MRHHRIIHQRRHDVVYVPHIGGRLQHHCIPCSQVHRRPFAEFLDPDPSRPQHPFLPDVLSPYQCVFLVNVDGDVSFYPACIFCKFHATLLLSEVWDVDFWVMSGTYRCGLRLAPSQISVRGCPYNATGSLHNEKSSHTCCRTTQTLTPCQRPRGWIILEDTPTPRPRQVHSNNASRWCAKRSLAFLAG